MKTARAEDVCHGDMYIYISSKMGTHEFRRIVVGFIVDNTARSFYESQFNVIISTHCYDEKERALWPTAEPHTYAIKYFNYTACIKCVIVDAG